MLAIVYTLYRDLFMAFTRAGLTSNDVSLEYTRGKYLCATFMRTTVACRVKNTEEDNMSTRR